MTVMEHSHPRIILLGPPLCGKTTQSKLLEKKYPDTPTIEINQLENHDAETLSLSGVFLNDNEAKAGYLKKLRASYFSTIIYLDVPDEVLVDRWHQTMLSLDSNHKVGEETR